MNRKSYQLSCLIPASLGLLGACNSGDINFPDPDWPFDPSGSAGVIQFTDASYSVTEGETINIRVSRSGGSSGWVAVDYACADGSAEAGSDFTAVSGRLTWPNGLSGNRTITIPITDDNVVEAAESFAVNLSNVSRASLGAKSSATVNIVDNDVAAVNVSGSISAADSVTIDGIRYNADATIVSVNGNPATASDLKLGQFVDLEGEVNFSDATGTANEISYVALVIGPVESADASGHRLTVLGQTVLSNEDTAFAASVDPDTFAGLGVGATVQISGFRNADDDIVATRIEPDSTSVGAQLIGTVAALDLANMRLSINGLGVDYGNATLIELPMGMPELGQLVMVRGLISNGVLVVEEMTGAEEEG